MDQDSFPDPFYNLNYGHFLQCTSETITICRGVGSAPRPGGGGPHNLPQPGKDLVFTI